MALNSVAKLGVIKTDNMQVWFLFDFSISFITLKVINLFYRLSKNLNELFIS